MQQFFQNSINLMIYFGKSDFFIIFTVNPFWKEIRNNLFNNQNSFNRLDIITRVFRAKLKYFIYLIRNGYTFGLYRIIIYIIKYQKRKLLYAYFFIFLNGGHAFSESERIDSVIYTKFPDRTLNPDKFLISIIKKMIIHNIYGFLNFNTSYIIKKNPSESVKYTKYYSRPFNTEIIVNKNSYPQYRRRQMIDRVHIR
jgi:hypothetical protein